MWENNKIAALQRQNRSGYENCPEFVADIDLFKRNFFVKKHIGIDIHCIVNRFGKYTLSYLINN